VDALEDKLDVRVVVAPQASTSEGFLAGSTGSRARALEGFLRDPSIRAVFSTTGGFNSSDLLDHIDWELLRSDPKILIGYSDLTSILVAGLSAASCITFYGPTLLPQFGEYPEPFPFTMQSLRDVLVEGRAPLEILRPSGWTNEFLDWGGSEWKKRPRKLFEPAESTVIRSGSGVGQLFGGNLETLNFLAGTRYLAAPEDVVLFFEVTAEEAFLPRVRRALRHLQQIGLLERMTALLVGRSPDATPYQGVTLQDLLAEVAAEYAVPAISELPFGHTDPMVTLPLGAQVEVDAVGSDYSIKFVAPSVGPRRDEGSENGP